MRDHRSGVPSMASKGLEKRIRALETQVAKLQSTIVAAAGTKKKSWHRAVEKYVGDQDLLAMFAAARKLREADQKKARRSRTHRSRT
jgi:hypothetical protein